MVILRDSWLPAQTQLTCLVTSCPRETLRLPQVMSPPTGMGFCSLGGHRCCPGTSGTLTACLSWAQSPIFPSRKHHVGPSAWRVLWIPQAGYPLPTPFPLSLCPSIETVPARRWLVTQVGLVVRGQEPSQEGHMDEGVSGGLGRAMSIPASLWEPVDGSHPGMTIKRATFTFKGVLAR